MTLKSPKKATRSIAERLSQRLPNNLRKGKNSKPTFASFIPNMTTILALCTGLSAVRFALLGRWNLAVMAILIAAVLDAMDGRLARMLNSTSRFGAELDSLADFINFGVSPALVIYLRSLHEWNGIGWVITLYFAVCMALRLARFNTLSIEGTTPAWAQYFFMGVPAPAGAILALTPLMIDFVFEERGWGTFFISPPLTSIVVFISASLLISRIPTLSIKKVHVPHKWVLPLLVFVALLAGALFCEPWMTLSSISILYVLSIPFTIKACRRKQTNDENI